MVNRLPVDPQALGLTRPFSLVEPCVASADNPIFQAGPVLP